MRKFKFEDVHIYNEETLHILGEIISIYSKNYMFLKDWENWRNILQFINSLMFILLTFIAIILKYIKF